MDQKQPAEAAVFSTEESDFSARLEKFWYSRILGDWIRKNEGHKLTGPFETFWKNIERFALKRTNALLNAEPGLKSDFYKKMEVTLMAWRSAEFLFENTIDKNCLEGRADFRSTFGYKTTRNIITRRILHIQLIIEASKKYDEWTMNLPKKDALMLPGPEPKENFQVLKDKLKKIIADEGLDISEVAGILKRNRSTVYTFLNGNAGPKMTVQVQKFVESRAIPKNPT